MGAKPKLPISSPSYSFDRKLYIVATQSFMMGILFEILGLNWHLHLWLCLLMGTEVWL